LRRATARDKSRGFKHFEVPRDGRHTHFKRLGKLRDGRLPGHQVRKDGAASGISKGRESGSELICWHFVFNQHVKYNDPKILSRAF
jgi:hypothetical protein